MQNGLRLAVISRDLDWESKGVLKRFDAVLLRVARDSKELLELVCLRKASYIKERLFSALRIPSGM